MATVILAFWAAALIRYDGSFFAKSWELLKVASYGQSAYEHAAFIVRDADGTQHFVAWPFRRQSYEATYFGTVPPGAVAIIHTHPNPLPYPSDGDAALARRTGLPVYVVTRSMITRTDGRRLAIIYAGDWSRPIQ